MEISDQKLRSHLVEPAEGWVSSKYLICESHSCGHCHECDDALLPSEAAAKPSPTVPPPAEFDAPTMPPRVVQTRKRGDSCDRDNNGQIHQTLVAEMVSMDEDPEDPRLHECVGVFFALDLDRSDSIDADELFQVGLRRRALGQMPGTWTRQDSATMIDYMTNGRIQDGQGRVSKLEFVEYLFYKLPKDWESFLTAVQSFIQVANSLRKERRMEAYVPERLGYDSSGEQFTYEYEQVSSKATPPPPPPRAPPRARLAEVSRAMVASLDAEGWEAKESRHISPVASSNKTAARRQVPASSSPGFNDSLRDAIQNDAQTAERARESRWHQTKSTSLSSDQPFEPHDSPPTGHSVAPVLEESLREAIQHDAQVAEMARESRWHQTKHTSLSRQSSVGSEIPERPPAPPSGVARSGPRVNIY